MKTQTPKNGFVKLRRIMISYFAKNGQQDSNRLTKSALLIQFLSWYIILVCFKSTEAQEGSTEHKLLFLHILGRHGARSPWVFYPTDPNRFGAWPEGKSKLTKLGKRQQYAVGKLLRSMYSDFITSNPNEVFVNSTVSDYSMRSAETLMASLYAPTREWKFVEELDWQPIPIHYEPDREKDTLAPTMPCKMASKILDKVRQSPAYKSKLKKFTPMLKDVMRYSGIEDDYPEWNQVLKMADNLEMTKANGLFVPLWAKYYWSEIDEFFQLIFNSRITPVWIQKIYSSFLVQKIVQNMEKKIAGEMPDRKVEVYSTHDLTLALLLSALDVYNGIRPPLSSTISLELHESPNNQKSVRILYLNSTEPEKGFQEPHVLTLNGCTEYCPYEYFLNVTKEMVTDDWDWDTECQNVGQTNV